MKIGVIATPIGDYIVANESLDSAQRKLKNQNVPALPVLRQDSLIGMLSAKDIAIANLTEPTVESRYPPRRVEDLSLSKVVGSNEDEDVDSLIEKATATGADYITVMGEGGRPQALVDLSPYQHHLRKQRVPPAQQQQLDESLKESFPASDPVPPP